MQRGIPHARKNVPFETDQACVIVEIMVRLARLERATLCLEGRCSIHLSYRRTYGIPQVVPPYADPGGKSVL